MARSKSLIAKLKAGTNITTAPPGRSREWADRRAPTWSSMCSSTFIATIAECCPAGGSKTSVSVTVTRGSDPNRWRSTPRRLLSRSVTVMAGRPPSSHVVA